MSISSHHVARRAAALAAAVALGAVAASCSDGRATTEPTRAPVASAERSVRGNDVVLGTTPGWAEGKIVEFFYTQNFFCAQPPHSGAPSQCEVGEDGTVDPPHVVDIPTLYVLTPQGFTPQVQSLHCPVAGSCVAHPSTIDLSRILGPGASNVPLPAHSHVIEMIGDTPGQTSDEPEPWELEVIGVKDPKIWYAIAQHRDLATVRAFQAAGKGITQDIPTNTYLFFGVRQRAEDAAHAEHP